MWAAIGVGTALEPALNRVIVDISAVLIGADRVVGSGLALAGSSDADYFSIFRTITGKGAADLVRKAYRGVAPAQRCEAVFTLRSGAAHLGYIDQDALEAAIADLMVIMDDLLPIIGKPSEASWDPDNTSVVDHILVETKDALLVCVEALLAGARRELDSLKSRVGDDAFVRVAQALSMKSENNGEDFTVHACPACGYDSQLSRYIDEPDMEILAFSKKRTGSRL